MTTFDPAAFYRQRHRQASTMAQAAASADIAAIHRDMAAQYAALIKQTEAAPAESERVAG